MDKSRWRNLSPKEQMGHLTSEWTRARHWENRGDEPSRQEALYRALEILEAMAETAAKHRRREIGRLREITAHCLVRSNAFTVRLEDLVAYGRQHL